MRWDSVDLLNKTITIFGKNRKSLSTPLTDKVARELAQSHQHFVETVFF
ncbi:hypothetical protein QUG02_10230 [Bacillus hominis]|uniref:Integrase n=1 Tax=Bacillus hominis TaxID=2817478 RepID=A0ABT7R6F3_9BACI|nr:hypothetical protein [Bacillus hominis]MDM5193356.1 hypothetical protein [Bacillus hominis]MDM5433078.1 hypothetical protein [Bacillus hominis]MDM5438500.1 hypothetical protein [Bacillus hominis]